MNNLLIYKNRKNTHSEKWDGLSSQFGADNLLPLWVADMDFEVPSCVKDALNEYIDYGIFGYYDTPQSYYDAVITWMQKRHNYEIKQEWVRYSPGVVPALNSLIQTLTAPGDAILIQQPVYYPFANAVNNNERQLVINHLQNDKGVYTIDFEDFEAQICQNNVKLFVLCSPHNPVGRVWTKDELVRMLTICQTHGVLVVSDEIHHDLIIGDRPHIPSAAAGSFDEIVITLVSATKTFNLASCRNSCVIIANADLRKKFDRFCKNLHLTFGNSFGYIAVQAAYENGQPWLEALTAQIRSNYILLKNNLLEALPELEISPLEGTYLTWVNLKSYVPDSRIKEIVQDKAGLAVDYGHWFGVEHYNSFIRINLATSAENIETAAARLITAIKENI